MPPTDRPLTALATYAKSVYDSATAEIAVLQGQVEIQSRRRAEALAALYDNTDMNYREIGLLIGLTGQRVHQIIASLGRTTRQEGPAR